jgi:ribonuclease HI
MEESVEPDAKRWLFSLMALLSHNEFTRLVVTLWAIWTARRKAIHEDIFQSPLSTFGFISSYLSKLRQPAKPTSMKPNISNRRSVQAKWIPPPGDLHKINVDAAVSKTGARGTAAALCRDHNGTYMGTSVLVLDGITDPPILETIACREALALAEDIALTNVLVASDCASVVTHIRGGSMGRNGSIISEIRSRAATLSSYSFVHEERASNFEAHNLARYALSLDVGRHMWLLTPYADHIPVNIIIDQ